MKEQSLILMISERMNENKKDGRNEHNLIRCSAAVRESLSISATTIDLEGANGSALLNIHQAYSDDIKRLKSCGVVAPADMVRVAFVTTDVMERLTNDINQPFAIVKCGLPKLKTLLLGADPEFLLFSGPSIVRASSVMQKAGPIGSDGAMIEVRPEPSPDPEVIVDNIKKIFTNEALTKPVQSYDWIAGIYHKDASRDYPVGGHIHIGNPAGISKIPQDDRNFLFAVLNKIIDELLALPMIKLDGADLGKSRRSDCKMAVYGTTGYGFYGEWRLCQGRLEHRTLSGLWLAHPKLSKYVLGTAKAIAEAVYAYITATGFKTESFKHPDIDLNNHKHLYRSDFDGWENIQLAKEFGCISGSNLMSNLLNNSRASSINKKFLVDWYTKIRRLETYNKYSAYVDGLYEVLKLRPAHLQKIDVDIKKNWIKGNDFII